ncbi:DHRS7 family protein [Megaselia abdita]
MWGFFSIIGLIVVLYYIIYLILWIVLDSDVELAFKERFGKPISVLEGKICWITGASSGIGKSLALELAKNNVKLVISARRIEELNKVKEECLKIAPNLKEENVLVLPMDLLNFDSHESKFKTVLDTFGCLDILVNNAGRSQRVKSWDSIDINVDRELFELDVFSVVNLSRVVVRYFKAQKNGRGHIAITSSGSGLVPVPFSPSYCGAKFAVNGYFSALKVDEPTIDVTCFCPGPIATPFLEECFTGSPDAKHGIPVSPNERRMASERCGKLFAVAIANKTMLSWVGLFPISALLYIVQYFPNLRKIVMVILGRKGMQAIREGEKKED